jgi:hypothetical protein
MASKIQANWVSQHIDWEMADVHEPMPWWAVVLWIFYASFVVGIAIAWWQG